MKNDTIQKLAHDMHGFLSCWREWKTPGSPFRLTNSAWFSDFTDRAKALANKPLRNCDRFETDAEAINAWRDEPPSLPFVAWLFAPAQEGGSPQ